MLPKIVELLRTELEDNEIDYALSDIRELAGDLVTEMHHAAIEPNVITAACLTYARFK